MYLLILPIPPSCKIYLLFRRIQLIGFCLFFKGQLRLEDFTCHPGHYILLLGNSVWQGWCSAYISYRMFHIIFFQILVATP